MNLLMKSQIFRIKATVMSKSVRIFMPSLIFLLPLVANAQKQTQKQTHKPPLVFKKACAQGTSITIGATGDILPHLASTGTSFKRGRLCTDMGESGGGSFS